MRDELEHDDEYLMKEAFGMALLEGTQTQRRLTMIYSVGAHTFISVVVLAPAAFAFIMGGIAMSFGAPASHFLWWLVPGTLGLLLGFLRVDANFRAYWNDEPIPARIKSRLGEALAKAQENAESLPKFPKPIDEMNRSELRVWLSEAVRHISSEQGRVAERAAQEALDGQAPDCNPQSSGRPV